MAYTKHFRPLTILATVMVALISSHATHANQEQSTEDTLLVGISAVDTKPEVGIPLAGYGAKERRIKGFIDWHNTHEHSFFFRPSNGTHTPIRSKVMVLQKANRKLVFISLDVIGIEDRFVEDLAYELRPLGIRKQDIVMSGTHTHSGPGTLSRKLGLELVAVDLFKRKNYNYMLKKVEQSVHLALSQLEPAELFTSSFEAQGMQRNKFRFKDQEHYNKKASFLLARSLNTHQWLGGMVNFAVHGGGMPVELLVYSSDFPGQVEINLEKELQIQNHVSAQKPVILFMNGAEGDVAVPERGVEYIEQKGAEFAAQAQPALQIQNMKRVSPEFSVQQKEVWMGIPGSPLKYCGGGFLKKSPIPLRIPLVGFMDQRAPLSVVRVGEITMFSWPGEPSTELGFRTQRLAEEYGHKDAWVLGLVNDYMTYFTTKHEYHEGAYDSCSSLYNWRAGKRVLRHYEKVLSRMKHKNTKNNLL